MTESDDPIFTPVGLMLGASAGTAAATGATALMIGGAAVGGMAAGGAFSSKDDGFGGMPTMSAQRPEQAKRTAEPVKQVSEQAKKTKRLRASMLTKDWGKPTLGYAGLLGE